VDAHLGVDGVYVSLRADRDQSRGGAQAKEQQEGEKPSSYYKTRV
jgi:hypothetical protein